MEYDDIIHLPHHQSKTRKRMSVSDRAAQFAPFAALTGHDEAVKETARLTEGYVELDDYELEELNRKLLYLQEHLDEKPQVTITYFVPDEKKPGGAYQTFSGNVKKLLQFEGLIVMEDETEIPIERILLIESDRLIP